MSVQNQKNQQPKNGSSKSKKCLLTCGSCSGLTRDRLVSGNKTVCEGQGKIPSAKACASYKADVFSLGPVNDEASIDKDILQTLSECIGSLTVPELSVLGALFLGEKKTRQHGYKFWQKVYIRVRGTSSDNYLNNFVTGRVLDADKEYVRVMSEKGKSCIQVVNDKNSVTLYTVEQFRSMRAEMIDLDKIVDPSTERQLKKSATSRIETVDFAVSSGLVEEEFKNKKVRTSHRQDLVSLVQKMNSGRILKRREQLYNAEGEISIRHV